MKAYKIKKIESHKKVNTVSITPALNTNFSEFERKGKRGGTNIYYETTLFQMLS